MAFFTSKFVQKEDNAKGYLNQNTNPKIKWNKKILTLVFNLTFQYATFCVQYMKKEPYSGVILAYFVLQLP